MWLTDLPLKHGYIAFSYIEVRKMMGNKPDSLKYPPRFQREGFQYELICECECMAWQWIHVPTVKPAFALKIMKKKQ